MYAILVDEPDGEPSRYVLSTAARTPESAMQLMASRAEEYVSERLEQYPGEDYTIVLLPEHLQVNVHDNDESDPGTAVTFCATAITEVV